MAPRHSPPLATQELTIMKVVWRLGDATVREVYEALRKERPVAYTPVMTMMKILEGKGYLRRSPEGRAYRYRPTRPEKRVMAAMVRDFVDRVFDGASRPLLAHLADARGLTRAEREKLRRLIDEAP
jgi:predicted transcriptional regulator